MKSQNFDEKEWKFEQSSGYAGARNIHTDEWIYADDYWKIKSKKDSYDKWQLVFKEYAEDSEDEDFFEFLERSYHAPKKL